MIGGVIINNKQYTLQGVPDHVFVNGSPSPFLDARIRLPIVDRVDEPEEGGFYTYYIGQKFPRKGVLTPDALVAVCIVKKIVKNGVYLAMSIGWLFAPILIIPKVRTWILWKVAEWYAKTADFALNRWYVNPKSCCPVVREFFRAAQKTLEQERWTPEKRWIADRIVLSIGMMLEYDDSYRYRFQDAFSEIDKVAFEKSGSKEIARVNRIINARETAWDEKQENEVTIPQTRFNSFVTVFSVFLFLFPWFKRKIKLFILTADQAKIALDEGDFYHCMPRYDYKHRGMGIKEKMKLRYEIDKEFMKTYVPRESPA